MKNILKFLFASSAVALLFASCDKVDSLAYNAHGYAVALTSNVTTIAPTAVDSNTTVVNFTWTDPRYASAPATFKYILEIDSTGRNFAKEATKIVIGSLSTSMLAKELNTILLGFGFAYRTAYDIDVRITSSYGNNNEQIKSNTLKLKVTPYVIPPKVVPPASGRLFLVGDASQGGWNNPVPVPTQEFSKIDSVTYGGVFNIVGGKQYLALPVNGDWSHKFAVTDNTLPGLSAGGDFGYDLSQNFPGPAASGWYRIIFDFQSGKFSVTPFTSTLPTNLYIVGDATAGGWNNPVPVPSQQLVRLNASQFELSLPLIGGKQYLLLPVNGDWSNKYAVADNTLAGLSAGGDFGYNLSQNFPGPATNGTYKISVNFAVKGANAANSKFTVK